MENEEQWESRTIRFRNLTVEEAEKVDHFAHDFYENHDVQIEVLIGPTDLETEKKLIKTRKEHFKRNKNSYLIGGICFVLGGAAACLLTRSFTSQNRAVKEPIVKPSQIANHFASHLKDEIDKVL